ncbi:MAG TPA: polysaccharide biosynthesis C-terminal domain-containing protein [Candidatus Limnocylindrales bacterium]|nr:polysaccharide biosynthesis C-terminal domain-containing protein [Candidatus Limnocylindrales bacterium]
MIGGGTLPASSRPFFAARIVALVAGLVGAVVTARLLGPDGRGALSLFSFAVLFFAALLGLGIPIGSYDVVARGVARPAAVVQVTMGLAVAAGVVAAAIGAALVAISSGSSGGVTPSVIVVGLGIGVMGMIASQASGYILLAIGAYRRAAIVQSAQPILAAIAFVIALIPLDGGIDGAIAAAAGASLVAGVGGLGLAWRMTDHAVAATVTEASVLVYRGIRTLGSELANVLSYRIDTVLVAAIAGVAALGRYGVAVQLLEPLWVVASSLAMGLLGLAAADAASAAVSNTTGAAVRASILVCIVGGLLGTGIVAIAGPALLGPGFGSVPLVMLCLVPGIAALGASKVLAAAVIGRGGLAIGSVIATIVVVTNVVINLVLIPRFDDVGAALASSGSYGLSAILWIVAWRRHGGRLSGRDVIPGPADAIALLRLLHVRGPAGEPAG